MFTRILIGVLLISLISACAGTQSSFNPTHKSPSVARQLAQRSSWEWRRKCEIMVLASNEPEKSHYLMTRCNDAW